MKRPDCFGGHVDVLKVCGGKCEYVKECSDADGYTSSPIKIEKQMKIKITDIREYQEKMEQVKANGFKAGDFKALGRELRDKFNLTDREAIDILLGKDEEILKLLEKQED